MSNSEFQDAYEDVERTRGAILSTPISELIRREALVVDHDDSVAEAVKAMQEHHIGCVLVRKQGRLAGIFTERDVLKRVVLQSGGQTLKVGAVMTPHPETLAGSASIAYALNKMVVGGFRHIPIVDESGEPMGVLSMRHIVEFIVELFPEEVLNLPPTPAQAIATSADEE